MKIFQSPKEIDVNAIKPKWNEHKQQFFAELIRTYELAITWQHESLENSFKEIAAASQIKPGDVLLPLRIMLVGGKFGPHVFNIAEVLGKEETVARIAGQRFYPPKYFALRMSSLVCEEER